MVSSVISYARAGNAYDSYGVTVTANTPQFSKLMPTGTVTNLLTNSQSDGVLLVI